MSQLSHLDELYNPRGSRRVRKACYALFNRQGQLCYAPPRNEGFLP